MQNVLFMTNMIVTVIVPRDSTCNEVLLGADSGNEIVGAVCFSPPEHARAELVNQLLVVWHQFLWVWLYIGL